MIKHLSLLSSALFLMSSPAFAEPLFFETQRGQTIPLDVEVARTPEQQQNGLMNRDSLDPKKGMLFIFDPATNPVFWMKDTKISLDMIYIDEQGIVIDTYENAAPYDETLIPPPDIASKAVVEINGGYAKKLGISKGDKVIHTIFKKDVK